MIFFKTFFSFLFAVFKTTFIFVSLFIYFNQKKLIKMKTTNFNAHQFYSETMHSVYQLIDKGVLSSVNEVDDYLLSEAQFYVEKATDEVIIATLPDNLRELNEQFGEVTSKKGLAWCSLVLWMQENEMSQDAIEYFAKKYNY